MKILYLLTIFFISITCKNDEPTDPYPVVVGIFKGMAKTDEAKCSIIWDENERKVKALFLDLIQSIKDGKDIGEAFQKFLLDLLELPEIAVHCKLIELANLVQKFVTKEGLAIILKNIIDNFDMVWDNIIKIGPNFDEKKFLEGGYNIGKIIATAFQFWVD